MRHFECIFLLKTDADKTGARIFTRQEELDFAGHPILGAAAALHDLYQPAVAKASWTFELNKKSISIITEKKDLCYRAIMNQGTAEFGKELNANETAMLLSCISLKPEDLYPGCNPIVVSTGLPYVIIPLQKNGLSAKINVPDLENTIRQWGAMFIGTLEIPTLSIRSWDNDGATEDIATGSLAGPVGAYLVKFGFQNPGTIIQISQGENLGRPSKLFVEAVVKGELMEILVSGDVCKVAQGILATGQFV
jgi:PhzF family phenazine biosynthesis protein